MPVEEICTLYLKGKNCREIGEYYNTSKETILRIRILHKNNILIRTNSQSHQKYSYDLSYFEQINTMNKAYLLGFLAADGFTTSTNGIGLCVNEKDKNVVEFFKKELKTDRPISEKNNNAIELRFQNKKMFEDVQKYGIVPNKTFILNIGQVIQAANLTLEQEKACLLGYFDGDGCITSSLAPNKTTVLWSCSVTGTKETCEYYKQYFNNVGFFTKRHSDEKNNFTY